MKIGAALLILLLASFVAGNSDNNLPIKVNHLKLRLIIKFDSHSNFLALWK
jgi:hypothetical protein